MKFSSSTPNEKEQNDNIGMSDIEFFPSIESVFFTDLDKCKELLFPICTIRLGSLKKEWGNDKIHLILYNEDPYNTDRVKYYNEFCKDNMVGFDIIKGKYKFKTDYGYFELTEEWKEWFNNTKETFAIDKENHLGSGYTYKKEGLNLGGKPSWWQADETPLDPDGAPMEFISEFGFDEKMFYLFYCHKYKLAVQIYQIT